MKRLLKTYNEFYVPRSPYQSVSKVSQQTMERIITRGDLGCSYQEMFEVVLAARGSMVILKMTLAKLFSRHKDGELYVDMFLGGSYDDWVDVHVPHTRNASYEDIMSGLQPFDWLSPPSNINMHTVSEMDAKLYCARMMRARNGSYVKEWLRWKYEVQVSIRLDLRGYIHFKRMKGLLNPIAEELCNPSEITLT